MGTLVGPKGWGMIVRCLVLKMVVTFAKLVCTSVEAKDTVIS